MDDEKIIEQAKMEFEKYVGKDKEKMRYADFECFLKNFFKDQPAVLKNLNVKDLFNEFSKEEKGKIDEREFRVAYKELRISRMDTSDRLIFDIWFIKNSYIFNYFSFFRFFFFLSIQLIHTSWLHFGVSSFFSSFCLKKEEGEFYKNIVSPSFKWMSFIDSESGKLFFYHFLN